MKKQKTYFNINEVIPKNFKELKEKTIKNLLFISAIAAVVVIFSILYFLFIKALPAFQEVGIINFLTGTDWSPEGIIYGFPAKFGALPLIAGTIICTIGAMVIAVPLSLGSAMFISELAPPKIKSFAKPAVELLAGIPSVVYGFFGLLVLTNWFRVSFDVPSGEGWFAGAFLLGIMALPTITSVAEDSISSVPQSYKEGSLALGATRWQTIKQVVIPSSLSGITAAIILGMGRAIGETMAVMMVTGNTPLMPEVSNLFSTVKTLTGAIAIEMGEAPAGSIWQYSLFGLAFILLIITLAINIISNIILKRLKEKQMATGKNNKFLKPETTSKIKNYIKYFIIGFIFYYVFSAIGLVFTILILITLYFIYFFKKNQTKIFKEMNLYHIIVSIFGFAILLDLFGLTAAIVFILFFITFYFGRRLISFKNAQRIAFGLIYTSIIIVIAILGILLWDIISNGIGAISWEFLTGSPRDLGRGGGIFPAIIGTFYLVIGAIIIALPIGVCSAIYLTEYTKEGKITKIIRLGADLLNGTPSIVFGLFGFAFLVLTLGWGKSMIAGQVTLAFMIIPTIIRTTEEALKAVPQSIREGSLALGATKWQTTKKVVLPPATPGVMTGAILGIGRAAGETAPILFTAAIFTSRFLPTTVFDPVMALPYHLYMLATTVPNSSQNQYGTALVLLIVVITLYMTAILIRNYYSKKMRW